MTFISMEEKIDEIIRLKAENKEQAELIETLQKRVEIIKKNRNRFFDENKQQADRIKELEKSFEQIQIWANAYPLEIFPKPDLIKAREVLKAAGMTLDSISADNMRHVLNGVKDIVEQVLKGE